MRRTDFNQFKFKRSVKLITPKAAYLSKTAYGTAVYRHIDYERKMDNANPELEPDIVSVSNLL